MGKDLNIEQIMQDFQKYQLSQPKRVPPGSKLQLVTEDAGTYESGQIFEAKTSKGGTNYIVFLMVNKGMAFYVHGDRAKKVEESKFKSLISYGDLVPIPREKADIERLALCVLGLNAMTHGLSFNDYLHVYFGHGRGSEIPNINA